MHRWQYPIYNGTLLNLIKKVKDNVVFLTQQVLISVNFSIVSFKKEMRKSLYRETTNHKSQLNKKRYLIHTWSDKAYSSFKMETTNLLNSLKNIVIR